MAVAQPPSKNPPALRSIILSVKFADAVVQETWYGDASPATLMLSGFAPKLGALTIVRPNVSDMLADVLVMETETVLPFRSVIVLPEGPVKYTVPFPSVTTKGCPHPELAAKIGPSPPVNAVLSPPQYGAHDTMSSKSATRRLWRLPVESWNT